MSRRVVTTRLSPLQPGRRAVRRWPHFTLLLDALVVIAIAVLLIVA